MRHTDATLTLRVYGNLFEGVQATLTKQLANLRTETTPEQATTLGLPKHKGAGSQDPRRTRIGSLAVNPPPRGYGDPVPDAPPSAGRPLVCCPEEHPRNMAKVGISA